MSRSAAGNFEQCSIMPELAWVEALEHGRSPQQLRRAQEQQAQEVADYEVPGGVVPPIEGVWLDYDPR